VDAQIVIYTVERSPMYEPCLRPLWSAAKSGAITVFTSELTVLETSVVPIRSGDSELLADFERTLLGSDIRTLPISLAVLREAARLRATLAGLRTPDAIHAATAALHGCTLFVTNDLIFKRMSSLNVAILDDVLASA